MVNTLFFLFANEILIFRFAIHKMPTRIAYTEDPNQTTSGTALFVYAFLAGNQCSEV